MAPLLRAIGLTLLLLLPAAATAVRAQSPGADASQSASDLPWLQIAQVGALMGGAYLGAVVARRYFDSGWMALIGARLGAGLGLEAAAAAGLLGIGVGSALPVVGTVAPQLVTAPAGDCPRLCRH